MTKDLVLASLKKTNGYISGEKISTELKITRSAVNNAIKSLREDGYDILSSTNRGYCLVSSPDKLSPGELLSYLPKERTNSILCLDTVDSTNSYLKNMALSGAQTGQVVIANSQSSGRGRLGRSFTSSEGKGIYMSYLFRPDCSPAEISNITAWTAVAVSRAIDRITGLSCGIKWVNDLVIENKKVCGILTEMSLEAESGRVQHVIIGIGVNVHYKDTDFPEEIRDIAASLSSFSEKEISRSALAAAIIEEIDKMICLWPLALKEYLGEYRERCISTEKEVYLIKNGENTRAFSEKIDDDFSLIVRYQDGTTDKVSSGEVSVRGIYGYI